MKSFLVYFLTARSNRFAAFQLLSLSLMVTILGLMSRSEQAQSADTQAVVNEKFNDLGPAIAELRQEVGEGRREIVQANMLLTDSERGRFWPLYDAYRAALRSVDDRKVRLITDYAAERDTMSEDDAKRLTREFFAVEREKMSIKEKHVLKMSKQLSARTVARFFQIDQKLDATVNLALAASIPLIQ